MKNFVLLSIVLIFAQASFAQVITNSGIVKLERKLFDETYEGETYDSRIERLEQKLFGTTQSGTLDSRYITLKSAIKNYKAYNPYSDPNYYYQSNQYQPPIFTGASGSSWKNTVLNNFKNQFVGTPTGITPAMDPAYMDWFEADRAGLGDSKYYRTNNGYGYNNTNRGTGMGVSILD